MRGKLRGLAGEEREIREGRERKKEGEGREAERERGTRHSLAFFRAVHHKLLLMGCLDVCVLGRFCSRYSESQSRGSI